MDEDVSLYAPSVVRHLSIQVNFTCYLKRKKSAEDRLEILQITVASLTLEQLCCRLRAQSNELTRGPPSSALAELRVMN